MFFVVFNVYLTHLASVRTKLVILQEIQTLSFVIFHLTTRIKSLAEKTLGIVESPSPGAFLFMIFSRAFTDSVDVFLAKSAAIFAEGRPDPSASGGSRFFGFNQRLFRSFLEMRLGNVTENLLLRLVIIIADFTNEQTVIDGLNKVMEFSAQIHVFLKGFVEILWVIARTGRTLHFLFDFLCVLSHLTEL